MEYFFDSIRKFLDSSKWATDMYVVCVKTYRCPIRISRPETYRSTCIIHSSIEKRCARYGDSGTRWHLRIRHESRRDSLLVNTRFNITRSPCRRSPRKSAISAVHELPFRCAIVIRFCETNVSSDPIPRFSAPFAPFVRARIMNAGFNETQPLPRRKINLR